MAPYSTGGPGKPLLEDGTPGAPYSTGPFHGNLVMDHATLVITISASCSS
jgi:hypothetical protein